ncbi:hypothetical protein N7512_010363 [Penicillium capsulatum]|nr:hypothetical protein N7512_010363 [Penicillium capsulatum]
MASWPGALQPSFSPVSFPDLFTGESWADYRSEIHYRRKASVGSSLNQGNEQGRRIRPRSSTVSGTLQPLSPRLSEASPPRTTSTAPIVPYNPVNNDSGDESTASSAKPANKARRWLQALPSQQSYSDHGATHTPHSSAKLVKLLGEVINLHEEVATKRFRARDMRHALRHQRDEEDDRRVALRKRLNLTSPETVPGEMVALNAAIEDLQVATASYRALELEYHRLEDDLGQREYILDKRMRKLSTRLRTQTSAGVQHVYNMDSDDDSSASYSSTGSGNQMTPQAAEYLSCIGDVRMLRERLSDLEAEYLAIIDQRDLRERLGISLDSEALGFLARYEDETAQIEAELERALDRARNHPEHKNNPDAEVIEDDCQQVLQEFLPRPPEDEPPPDPLLITELEDRSPFFESARPVPLEKATFVNRWLLHRLRHSKLEIMNFKSRPELLDLDNAAWDRDSISKLALMLWYRDETAQMKQVGSYSVGER